VHPLKLLPVTETLPCAIDLRQGIAIAATYGQLDSFCLDALAHNVTLLWCGCSSKHSDLLNLESQYNSRG